MSPFPDTSFLHAVYRHQLHSPKADAVMAALKEPLSVSTLVLGEFRQSIRFQTWLHSVNKANGFSEIDGDEMLRSLQADLAGKVLAVAPVDWTEAHGIAERLSVTYTRQRGHRFADILHVATALHLGAAEFLTFDRNQQRLAEAEGLKVAV